MQPETKLTVQPFNSRPHTEVDELADRSAVQAKPFNSRPHTEVDEILMPCKGYHKNFQLTTSHGGRRHSIRIIIMFVIFQLTTSHGGRLYFCSSCSNFSPFQLTTSHGGRLSVSAQPRHLYRSFNSRPHTEVDTQRNMMLPVRLSFNSRPHTEVDFSAISLYQQIHSFNSRPHTEVDTEGL